MSIEENVVSITKNINKARFLCGAHDVIRERGFFSPFGERTC